MHQYFDKHQKNLLKYVKQMSYTDLNNPPKYPSKYPPPPPTPPHY